MKDDVKYPGKLIVIEGSDGSGKTTQLQLLKEYLETKKIPVATIDFPRYYISFHGKIIARFLRGEFGDPSQANPYLISIVYAADRENAAPLIYEWLKKGNVVLSNRYVPSNLAHQAGKLSKKERDVFIQWELELEYDVNKIPKEDIAIYLHVPYKVSLELMKGGDRAERTYVKGTKDKVEENATYLRNSERAYNYLTKKFPHWVKIECVQNGVLRTREDIHNEVKNTLQERRLIL